MPYNNIISRTDAAALIPEEVSREMLGFAPGQSAALSLFRRIPVARGQVRFPVLSALPTAYWVTGDTGLKQTSEINWTNKFLNIEEIAVIIPVPDNVIADVEANIWDEAVPLIVEAFGRTLDTAIFFGTNAPGSFPTNVLSAANSAGNSVTEGTAAAAAGGFFGDLDATIATVEADGFDINGFVANVGTKAKLRAARATDGNRLDQTRVNGSLTRVWSRRLPSVARAARSLALVPTLATKPLMSKPSASTVAIVASRSVTKFAGLQVQGTPKFDGGPRQTPQRTSMDQLIRGQVGIDS